MVLAPAFFQCSVNSADPETSPAAPSERGQQIIDPRKTFQTQTAWKKEFNVKLQPRFNLLPSVTFISPSSTTNEAQPFLSLIFGEILGLNSGLELLLVLPAESEKRL